MINCNNISIAFGSRYLFDSISLRIDPSERIGLVGRNGAGKSTLLKLIVGQARPDSGTIVRSKGLKIGYMAQDVVLHSNKSILDEALSADAHYWKIRSSITEIEKKMEADSDNGDLVEQYAELQEQYKEYDPFTYETDVKKIITGLGFAKKSWNDPVDSLSVGWKMRLVLAKLLLQKADFYLFDEPTNHLDIVAREWFVRFLQQSSFGFMIISHERYFLNTLCDKIIELENGKATIYDGNYDDYEIRKEELLQSLIARYKLQQKDIKRKRDLINKFRAKASKAKFAQSLIRELDKMVLVELPPSVRNISIKLQPTVRTGQNVLTVNNLAYSFPDKPVFKDVSFDVIRGQRMAIVAANGVGKTTLLNCITGKLKPTNGTVTFGHNVEWALFDQDQTHALDLKKSIVDNISESVTNASEQQIRTMLGSFLFPKDDVYKKVTVLSGGEKNRVGIIKTLLMNANFLLLDEPTNHLDIISKDILKKALQAFDGTILFVSHDHDFISDIADSILELSPTGAHYFPGSYEEYLFFKESLNEPQSGKSKKTVVKKLDNSSGKDGRLLERTISKLESKIEKAQAAFADLEYGTSEFDTQCDKLDTYKSELEGAMAEWEKLQG